MTFPYRAYELGLAVEEEPYRIQVGRSRYIVGYSVWIQ